MSDANQESRSRRLYIQDMIGFSEKVLSYTDGEDLRGVLSCVQVVDSYGRQTYGSGQAS